MESVKIIIFRGTEDPEDGDNICPSEMSVNFYHTTLHHNQKKRESLLHFLMSLSTVINNQNKI